MGKAVTINAMILCVVPNTAIEYTWAVPGFRLGEAHHVTAQTFLASGKGMNVARTIKELGGRAFCAGFLAGHNGRLYIDLASHEGIPGEWIWVDGETRIATAIYDPNNLQMDATLISAHGPVIAVEDWDLLAEVVLRNARKSEMVCFSGSLPPSTPLDQFQALIGQIQANGMPVWVDGSGSGLAAAIQARAFGIKANGAEIGEALNSTVSDPAGALEAGRVLLGRGIHAVVVTLGSEGAVLINETGAWIARPPAVQRLSSVGSGDAFLGSMLLSLSKNDRAEEVLRKASAAGAANTLLPGGGRLNIEDYDTLLPKVEVKQLA